MRTKSAILLWISCLGWLSVSSAHAGMEPDLWLPTQCTVSPFVAPIDKKPAVVDNTSNHLVRYSESMFAATGTHILIMGRLYDKDCTPIPSANITLWQADPEGNMRPLPSGTHDFTYSGMTETNNMGQFSFFTLIPGARHHLPPAINIAVQHPDFPHYQSQFFFNVPLDSDTTKAWDKLSSDQQQQLLLQTGSPLEKLEGSEAADSFYYLQIVLPQTQMFKYYG